MEHADPRRLFDTEPTEKTWQVYGRALIAIASADGDFAHDERQVALEIGREYGICSESLECWASFDWRAANREELVRHAAEVLSEVGRRRLIYDAVRISWADSAYPIQERDAVAESAQQLGVDPLQLQTLEVIVDLERTVANLKGAVL